MVAPKHFSLKRTLGTPTAFLIAAGVAIGSGIFRSPGEVAARIQIPWLIVLAWVLGGVMALMQALVTAELATRYPRAGGEYVYLKEAYGEFVAFFFGWAYTIFIIGGGVATIAVAFGDFACRLFALQSAWSGLWAAAAIVSITGVNALGLRVAAGAQNALTGLKILAVLTLVVIGFTRGGTGIDASEVPNAGGSLSPGLFLAGMLPVLWCYYGATDTAKMAEEIKDVRRTLPRALIGSAVALTVLYVLLNTALMRVMPPRDMAGLVSVPGEAMNRLYGPGGEAAMLIVGMVVFLGTLSSTILATIRVTFALARDGLAFGFMSRMSRAQAPVPALLVVAGFATILALRRGFMELLGIYFFASAILFGLSYGSLIVFRLRDKVFPSHAFRCPFGPALATILILIQLALAVNVAIWQGADALYTTVLLASIGLLYLIWKRTVRSS